MSASNFSAPNVCPSCGFDLAKDMPRVVGDWVLRPYDSPIYKGAEIRITPQEAAILWSIVKAGGRPISRHAIMSRCGSEDAISNTTEVLISRLRQKIRDAGVPLPFENLRGRGYRWVA